ncbi:MAG: transcriptional repressor [Pirellulaceae bacterium]
MSESLSIDDARRMLRGAGLRCTTCRVAVLQHLWLARSPLSHAEVADELVPSGYDKSTVYRCLIELADAGFFSRLDAGDHVWRFEMRQQADAEHDGSMHPHFMCVDCGKVTCLPEVTVKIAPTKGPRSVQGSVTEVLLKGHCASCN